ncbi:sulfatase-like hydrolase/transferase [Pedobacter sp. SD-b]|uniref:Sulfatase-like hydrolase/transferase n=1 Tax=Pedobacter segetis TaxID=2793069 RepID=A0ABS1BLD5_9SPHI|nr:sulfatase-like hydrolase/transferase [Pedobacter segetis]MBK0383698.1 sulfatase-like hydrolase/transferase [Pedobacter segetis]
MKTTCLTLVLFLSLIQVGSSQTKPNIIIIYADDLGFADLGSQGSVKDIKTPNIDLLAKEGIRFSAGYVTAPQCSPSRAGLLTGRYQERFGFDEIPDGPLPLTEITLARRLSKAGYVTGQVGKWHLEPNPVTKNWITKNIPNAAFSNGLYKEHIPDSLTNLYMPGSRGFQQYFTGYINDYLVNFDLKSNLLRPSGENIHQPGYRLDIQTDAALQFIKRNQKQPFFLYLAYFGPHVPLEATKKYLDRFPEKMPERRRYALAMISAIDDGVGRINEMLKQYGIDDNTMIVFASDNGAPLGIDKEDLPYNDPKGKWDGSLNDPMLGEKGMLTEGGIRVPFIIRWSKLSKGIVYNKPVSTLDIAATAVSLAGLPKDKALDGVNLVPFLSGKNTVSPHDYLFWRFWTQTAVRDSKWKFINAGNKGTYLFDIDKDPEEKNNLVHKYPEIAEKLKGKLQDWAKQLVPPGIPYKNLRDQEVGWYNYYLRN